MDWVNIGKLAVKAVAGSAVSGVVMNVVKATMPKDAKSLQKVSALVGGYILSSMIADQAGNYVVKELELIFPPVEEKPETTEEKPE